MHKSLNDANLDLIAGLITPKSRVLDLGCGQGKLLKHLKDISQCSIQGIDVSQDEVIACISRGVPVLQLDLEEGLSYYKDQSFDYIVISQTMQQVAAPHKLIREALRVGKKALVSIHNLAYWKSRFQISCKGRMPYTESLPHEWYNTPNIHLGSIKDFQNMCQKENFRITAQSPGGSSLFINLNHNLFSEFCVFTLEHA